MQWRIQDICEGGAGRGGPSEGEGARIFTDNDCICSSHFTALHHQLTTVGLICMKGHVWK